MALRAAPAGALLVVLCAAALVAAPAPGPRQTQSDSPFKTAVAEGAKLTRLRSLLISVNGTLVEERYFRGATAARAANIKSASKSIIAILVGIAIDRGQIPSVETPLSTYFPEHLKGQPDKAGITVADLLSMRSGLETTSNRNYGRWVQSPNWVRHVLQRPLVDEPGGRMIYSTGSSHLLSAILTKTSGASTLEFARRNLAAPLGIGLGAWVRDPQGIYLGGNEMHMTPRDMLKIGDLYLNEGRRGDRQIVSAAWVRESLRPRTTSEWSGREYGYGWWIRSLAGRRVFYAWGYGGQFIFVVPDLRTVVVTTSVVEAGSERREHLGGIYDIVEQHIIPNVVMW